jgi:integrase
MRQFVTTDDFKFKDKSHPGMPLLVDNECVPVPVVSSYMMYVVVQKGNAHSPLTWKNNCDSLYDYFSWLEAQGLRWDDEPLFTGIGREVSNLALYQRWCHETYCKENGEKLAHSTINSRIAHTEAFYKWARDIARLIDWVPYITVLKTVRLGHPGFMAHTHGQKVVESSDLRLPTPKIIPNVLSLEQCRELMMAPMSQTLRTATWLMLCTGLRNEECRTFPRKYVFDPRGLNRNHRIKIDLNPQDMRTKGSKKRSVFITWQMMATLYTYTKFGERPVRARLFEKANRHPPLVLFLNDSGAPFSTKGLNNRYRDLCKGYERRDKSYPPTIPFEIHPHKLRHTFATMELYYESERTDKFGRKKGLGHALSWVQKRLGHSSLQSTSIYVHCLNQLDNHELNIYQQELDRMMAEKTDAS